MNRRTNQLLYILLTVVLLLVLVPIGFAQRAVNLAYINAGGQLVVTDSNGTSRWVVTNPGETVLPTVNLAWSPNGDQLFFGVQANGGNSLRVAAPSSSNIFELATVDGTVAGGEWTPDGRTVLVGLADGIYQLGANSAAQLIPNAQISTGQTISPDGRFLFYYAGSGFAVNNTNGSTEVLLPGRNNPTATGVGLWAASSPFVAHWGFAETGTSALVVTNAATGDAVTLDSGSSVPITPLIWQGDTLLFRSAVGIQAVNLACLSGGCASVPTPSNILPVDATNISITEGVLVFARGGQLFGSSGACISSGNCAANAVTLGNISNAYVSTADGLSAFTTADGSIQAVNLNCVDAGACSATNTGIRGNIQTFAPNGEQVLAFSGSQLQIINLSNISASIAIDGVGNNRRVAWGI